MYCPKCGTKNDNNDIFCENCGERITEVKEIEDKTTFFSNITKYVNRFITKIINLTKMQKIIGVFLLAFLSVLISLFGVFSYLTSPSYIALELVKSISNLDYERYYELTDFSNSEFISKELFISSIEKEPLSKIELEYCKAISLDEVKADAFNTADISDYITSKDNEVTIIVEFKRKNFEQIEYAPITLQRMARGFLFFPKWVNSGVDYTTSNYDIYALKGSIVTFNGIPLTDEYLVTNSNENFDLYRLPKVLKVKTKLEMITPSKITITSEVTPSENAYKPENVSIDQDSYKKFNDVIELSLTNLMTSATTTTTFEEFSKNNLWSKYDDDDYTLEKIYNNIKMDMSLYSTKYDNIKITKIKNDNNFTITDDGYFTVEVDMGYSYDRTYTSFTGEEMKNNLIDSYNVEITFTMEDNSFYIKSFNKTFVNMF